MNNVVKTIIEQIGGNRAFAMIGAKNVIFSDDSLHVKFPGAGKGWPNKFVIRYDAGSDDYRVEFWRVGRVNFKPMGEFAGVYADQLVELIESKTGLYLSL